MIVEPPEIKLETKDMFNLWINGKLNQTLIKMLLWAEVRGTLDNHDDNAIGDKELKHKAYGCMQIRDPYIKDALGDQYKAEDCLGNHELSMRAVEAYMKRYTHEKRLGYKPTLEDGCRIHNGGPEGYKRKSTFAYWNSIAKEFDL